MPAEDELWVGDRVRIGTAELVVSQPRLPCFKLGLRFGDAQMVKRFQAAGRLGVLPADLAAGSVEVGDSVEFLRTPDGWRSGDRAAGTRDRGDVEGLRRALAVDALIDNWRLYFEELLERASGSEGAAAAGG